MTGAARRCRRALEAIMEVVHPHCAGLDVHKQTVVACVRVAGDGPLKQEVRTFATTTSALLELTDWLESFGVEQVAMEATSVYWKPVWHVLEGHFELILANAAHVKNVPGRKTDVGDATWLADLLAHGLIRASFVPPRLIGMEACGGAQHWARKLRTLGHDVRLMAPQFVKPYVQTTRMMQLMPRQSARPWHGRTCVSCRSGTWSNRRCWPCTGCVRGSSRRAPRRPARVPGAPLRLPRVPCTARRSRAFSHPARGGSLLQRQRLIEHDTARAREAAHLPLLPAVWT